MDSIIMAIVLCQIHMQAVEYILDDQPLNSEQVSNWKLEVSKIKIGS